MSFLVSFNGQFTPHVYQVTAQSALKITAPQAVLGIKSQEHPHAFEEVLNDTKSHAPPKGIQAYQKQLSSFEDKKKRVYAHDLMSAPLHTMKSGSIAQRAKDVMQQMGFRHLPVVDSSENLLGLLTERDLLMAKESETVDVLMQKQVIVGQEKTRIQDIAHLMLEEKLNALPIVNDKHKLVGIITLSDILKFVIHLDEFKERA